MYMLYISRSIKYSMQIKVGYEIGKKYTTEQTMMWDRIKFECRRRNGKWMVLLLCIARVEEAEHGVRECYSDERVDTHYYVSSLCKTPVPRWMYRILAMTRWKSFTSRWCNRISHNTRHATKSITQKFVISLPRWGHPGLFFLFYRKTSRLAPSLQHCRHHLLELLLTA